MFLPEKGWNWLYSRLFVCAREGVELAIFIALCLCQRSGETGYIHSSVFVPEKCMVKKSCTQVVQFFDRLEYTKRSI